MLSVVAPAGGVAGEVPLASAMAAVALVVMLSPSIVKDFPDLTASDVLRIVGICAGEVSADAKRRIRDIAQATRGQVIRRVSDRGGIISFVGVELTRSS